MTTSLPDEFINRIKLTFPEQYDKAIAAFESVPSPALRMNPLKAVELDFELAAKIPFNHSAFWLKERVKFHHDPLWHGGAYYVQDASSMILELFWKQLDLPDYPLVADLCAAPGGKSTHLLELLNGKGFLLSNEMVPKRNVILQENLWRWGYSNYAISQNNTDTLGKLSAAFDVVLVDAPCSGEGLFGVSEIARTQWNQGYIEVCAQRQRDILDNAKAMLKPGGYLIYSTCTTNRTENDDMVDQLINSGHFRPVELNPTDLSDLQSSNHAIQIWPHKFDGRALYMSMLQKISDDTVQDSVKKRTKKLGPTQMKSVSLNHLPQVHSCINIQFKDEIFLLEEDHLSTMEKLEHICHFKSIGTPYGTDDKKSRPHPAAALAAFHLPFPKINLEIEEARSFLKGEVLSVTADKGWLIASYKGIGLGWGKNIGSRTNNYYPKSWRMTGY